MREISGLGLIAPRVGTAGWSIPRLIAEEFPGDGSHLERYSRVLRCAEINSTFYRPHRAGTLARWAAATPDDFEFAVKVRRTITHECGLRPERDEVRAFAGEVRPLGEKLGPLLFQLPPKQGFEAGVVRPFFEVVRGVFPEGRVVLEPRHASWFEAEPEELMREFRVARVAADPVKVPEGAVPGGWPGLVYYRLHGSPRVYYSAYAGEFLDGLAAELRLRAREAEVWCVFDNTASGAAAGDALRVQRGV